MHVAIVVFAIGLVISGGLAVVALWATPKYWNHQAQYITERIEKACDSVAAIVAFLIPAALAIATWVYEKTGTPWYGACLALSTLWFLFVLGFTMYIRFNLVWGLPEKVVVGNGRNLGIVRWLTSIMVGLTAGLFFLAIPTFTIAFSSHPPDSKDPCTRCECHVDTLQSSREPCRAQAAQTVTEQTSKPPARKGK